MGWNARQGWGPELGESGAENLFQGGMEVPGGRMARELKFQALSSCFIVQSHFTYKTQIQSQNDYGFQDSINVKPHHDSRA